MARSEIIALALVVAAMALLASPPTRARASFIYTEEDLASDESMWALHERWAAHHEVVRQQGEKARRFPIFKKKARQILDKYGSNKQGGNLKQSAINIFGDRTYEEIITLKTGLREEEEEKEVEIEM